MFNLDIELEPKVLENGIETTLLKIEEMNVSGNGVPYKDLIKTLEGDMGDNVAAIILKTERRGLIGRGQIKKVENGKTCPIIITDQGKKRLEEIKRTKE
ncbi:MAG: hypothetical protein WA063_07005 [Minisyncoccia bacterium]